MERALSIGDSIGLAVRQCRADLRLLVSKLFWPSVLQLIGKVLLVWASQIFLLASEGGATPTLSTSMQALAIGIPGLLFTVPAELWLTLRQLAYVRVVVLKKETYEEAAKVLRPRVWSIIVYVAIFYVILFLWGILSALMLGIASVAVKAMSLPGVVAVVIVCLIALIVMLSLLLLLLPASLIFAVLACEDKGTFGVLGRVFELMFGKFPRVLGFATLLSVASVLLHFALTSILQILYGFEYFRAGAAAGQPITSEAQLPMYLQVIGCVWQTAINMYLMPVIFLSSGLFYYSLRTEEEGLEIIREIDTLQEEYAR